MGYIEREHFRVNDTRYTHIVYMSETNYEQTPFNGL